MTASLPVAGYFATEAGPVFVRTIGEGPPMVVVHGGPGLEHSYLVKWLSPLADQRTFVFYDQEGCGQDPTANPLLTGRSAVRQLAALITALCGSTGTGFFAHSWGTYILLNLLLEQRIGEVTEAVLCNPFALDARRFAAAGKRLTDRIPQAVIHHIEVLEERGDDASGVALMQALLPYYLGSANDVPCLEFTSYRGLVNTRVLESLGDFDSREAIACLPARTLIIYGDRDFILPSDTAEIQASPAKAVTLPDCGHFPFAERPREFADVIRPFLR